jgi:hypothetical protein
MLPTAVSSAGSRGGMLTWTFTGGGASTGTAARGAGSKGERVPRTGWRFVRHLNRLSALAFLRPVRKGSLGAEFPAPFREPILRPGLPTSLPRAGRAQRYRTRRAALGDPDWWRSERARIFVLGPRPGGEVFMPATAWKVSFALRDRNRPAGAGYPVSPGRQPIRGAGVGGRAPLFSNRLLSPPRFGTRARVNK